MELWVSQSGKGAEIIWKKSLPPPQNYDSQGSLGRGTDLNRFSPLINFLSHHSWHYWFASFCSSCSLLVRHNHKLHPVKGGEKNSCVIGSKLECTEETGTQNNGLVQAKAIFLLALNCKPTYICWTISSIELIKPRWVSAGFQLKTATTLNSTGLTFE